MALGSVPTNNLTCYKGEDFSPNFQVGSDLTADITGWTLVCTVKTADADVTPALTLSGVVTDGPNRKFNIPFTAAQLGTTGLQVGAYLYDLWRTDVGFKWVLTLGSLTILTERRVQVP